MVRRLVFIISMFPVFAMAQYHIAGKVKNILNKAPVDNANVFLSNASAGAKTNPDGSFDISNVRSGHYELVVSIVGYITYHQNIVVNDNMSLPDVLIEQQNITLKEVTIRPDPNWEYNYDAFKKEFLGSSDNAYKCKILNPQMVDVKFDIGKHELTASSYDFIEIENRALGYKIKYLLSQFTKSTNGFNSGMLYYEGSALFEDLQGKESEVKKWKKNRLESYLGSDMHFLRSVIANKVEEEGFTVRRLIRKPNPEYGHGSSKKYTETLITTPLKISEYVRLTDQKGEYALEFSDYLYITYRKKSGGTLQTSIINFNEPHVFFDDNGIIINPSSALFEDAWGSRRIAELLPVDYDPAK